MRQATPRGPLQFRTVGAMSYEVRERATGELLGTVWRTRDGWTSRRSDGSIATRDYPGSRATAAGLLRHPPAPGE